MKPIKKGMTEAVTRDGRKVTQHELKQILFYDQDNGLFYWKVSKNNRVKVGSIAGSKNKGYTSIMINGCNYSAHRLAWLYVLGKWPDNEIDHINGEKDDNRFSNLRQSTHKQNLENLITPNLNNKSGFLGVYFNKQKNKYEAAIKHHGKKIYIGRSDSAKEAHQLYLNKKRELHEFCTI